MNKPIKWTAEMEAKLMHLIDDGGTMDEVSEALQISRIAVWRKACELYGLLDKYDGRGAVGAANVSTAISGKATAPR